MSGQIWTVATLKTHLDTRIDDLDRRLTGMIASESEKARMNLRASEDAINKAEKATELRFQSVNEFRATLSDQANMLIPRTEVLAYFQRLAEQMASLQSRLDRLEGSSGHTSVAWGYVFAVIGSIAAIVMAGIGLAR